MFNRNLEHNRIPAKVCIYLKTAVKKPLVQLFKFKHKDVRLWNSRAWILEQGRYGA